MNDYELAKKLFRYCEETGRPHPLRRLIFLLQKESFLLNDVDHIDSDRLNNSWSNLREVKRSEDIRNVRIKSNNSIGFHKVSFRKDINKYATYIDVDRVMYRGGSFTKLIDAVNKRRELEKIFGFHNNHGKRSGWGKS